MGIHLPIMNGYTVTRQIKANPALRWIPVIAITSHAATRARLSFKSEPYDIKPPTSLIIQLQKPDVRERIMEELVKAFRPYERGTQLAVNCQSIMATGVKPH